MRSQGFPAVPKSFVPVFTPARTRIFLATHHPGAGIAAPLFQVTTVNGTPEEAALLVSALNTAAWSGDRARLEELLSTLPQAVGTACTEALDECPPAPDLAIGYDGEPMSVLRSSTFSGYDDDLRLHLEAAMDVGLQVVVQNSLDSDGRLEREALLLSDDREVTPEEATTGWPVPPGARVLERMQPDGDEFSKVLSDPRWETHVARAYWLWMIADVREDGHSATATWVVEFLDSPLQPESNFRGFVDQVDQDEQDGLLTTRTRFLLWLSLGNIAVDLDELVAEWPARNSQVLEDMPRLVQEQPREWWFAMHRSAERLCEAARRGDWDAVVPRTVAEEALLATRESYIDCGRDSIGPHDLDAVLAGLPASPDGDEVWGELLPALTGDADVEMLWDSNLAAQADPAHPMNKFLGMGDYRPAAWHRFFDRTVRGLPSALGGDADAG